MVTRRALISHPPCSSLVGRHPGQVQSARVGESPGICKKEAGWLAGDLTEQDRGGFINLPKHTPTSHFHNPMAVTSQKEVEPRVRADDDDECSGKWVGWGIAMFGPYAGALCKEHSAARRATWAVNGRCPDGLMFTRL